MAKKYKLTIEIPKNKLKGDELSKFLHKCLEAGVEGDAAVFTYLAQDRFLLNRTTGKWLKWAGHHWTPDVKNEHLAVFDEAATLFEKEARKIGRQLENL